MRIFQSAIAICVILEAGSASSQTIQIIEVREVGDVVEMLVETDMATPFEVMAGVDLAGQAADDIYIGNSTRAKIIDQRQTLRVPAVQNGEPIPSGEYEAVVTFYPRWGAEDAPASTKAVKEQVEALVLVALSGSGEDAADVDARNQIQHWVMMNTAIGDAFDLDIFISKLGMPEPGVAVTNRQRMVAHYFPNADMTLFENLVKGTLVTWKFGRHNAL